MTVLLVILPWHIDAVGHDAPLLHSVLVIVALATGITVWHRIIRWKSIINDFVEGILDGEIRARQEQEQRMTAKTNELEARLDSNAKELSRQYDDKINRLTTDLNDMLSSLPRQVYGMEKNMDTLVHKMGQLEALAKNALEANNAKTDTRNSHTVRYNPKCLQQTRLLHGTFCKSTSATNTSPTDSWYRQTKLDQSLVLCS